MEAGNIEIETEAGETVIHLKTDKYGESHINIQGNMASAYGLLEEARIYLRMKTEEMLKEEE